MVVVEPGPCAWLYNYVCCGGGGGGGGGANVRGNEKLKDEKMKK